MKIEHMGSMTCNLEFGNVQECFGSKHVGSLVVGCSCFLERGGLGKGVLGLG